MQVHLIRAGRRDVFKKRCTALRCILHVSDAGLELARRAVDISPVYGFPDRDIRHPEQRKGQEGNALSLNISPMGMSETSDMKVDLTNRTASIIWMM